MCKKHLTLFDGHFCGKLGLKCLKWVLAWVMFNGFTALYIPTQGLEYVLIKMFPQPFPCRVVHGRGAPSSLLFALAIEPFALAVCQMSSVGGHPIWSTGGKPFSLHG